MHRSSILKPFAAALLVLSVGAAAPAQTTGLGSPQLDDFITQQMFHNAPGLAAAVVKDGELIWSKGYGFADVQQQTPVTPDTVFHVGSISKTVVATAVMQRWEEGEFELDDDVNDYLPFDVRSPNFPATPITFRMLLQHASGLVRHDAFANLPLISLGADSPMSLGDYLADSLVPGGALYNPAVFNASMPGTLLEYSNIGYGLLGYLVEVISGTPFDQYCTENIFAPLGMTRTTWRLNELLAGNIAQALPQFWVNTTQSYQVPFGHHAFPNYPPAGLRTTVNDLARFLLAHMNGGTYGGAAILLPETVELMHTMHSGFAPGDGWTWGYGFGFEIILRGPQQEQPSIGHGGATIGPTSTEMRFRVNRGVGAIVFANGYGGAVLNASGFRFKPGHEFSVYSFIPERLLDEAQAHQP
jgi:CubicO group peptidase (beta-lactamase class C family)